MVGIGKTKTLKGGLEMNEISDRSIAKTFNGNPVFRKNLQVLQYLNSWIVLDSETVTVLTQSFTCTSAIIHYPVLFKSAEDAHEWIDRGTIGDVQEGHSNLKIGFTSQLVSPPGWQTNSNELYYKEKKYG